MKKMKMSKKLKESSIENLNNHLTKKRQRTLPKVEKDFIKKLVAKRVKEIDKEAWDYVNSPIFNLAYEELIRERKAKKLLTDDNKIDRNLGIKSVAEVVRKMLEVINLAHDKGYGDVLNTL